MYNLQLPYKYDRPLLLFKHVSRGDIWQLPLEGNTTGWSRRTGRIHRMGVMVIRTDKSDRTTMTDGTDRTDKSERTDRIDISYI